MNSALLIVAAGKSSRFGGYPKALCMLKDEMNVDNTIKYARKVFDEIYLGLNVETVNSFDLNVDAKILSITTGQGDAMSLLKLTRLVKKDNPNLERLFVCWGDAFFVDETTFIQFKEKIENDEWSVACSIDEKPYAWFDVDSNNYIIKSHFKKTDGEIDKGIHDQSLFCFDLNTLEEYLMDYKDYLGLNSEDYDPNETKEVRLLDIFNYHYELNKPVKAIIIDANKILSFNTKEELDKIVEEYC